MKKLLPSSYFTVGDLPGEIWAILSNWDGVDLKYSYYISNRGRIKNMDKDLLAGQDDKGYHQIQLSFVGGDRPIAVHKLVLTLFSGPPPSNMHDPTVNPIDHNKLNNCIENLEWLSRSDNGKDGSLYSYPATKMCIQIKTQSGEIFQFNSQGEANIYLHNNSGYLSACIHNGLPVLDSLNNEVWLKWKRVNSTEWICHVPNRLPQHKRLLCNVYDNAGTHTFTSLTSGSKYLNQNEYYLGDKYAQGKHQAVNKITQELVEFEIIEPNYLPETILNCSYL